MRAGRRYERIRYNDPAATSWRRRTRTITAEILSETPALLLVRPVDKEGNDRSYYNEAGEVVDVQHLIELDLILDRVPLRFDLHYGQLIPDNRNQPVTIARSAAARFAAYAGATFGVIAGSEFVLYLRTFVV